MPPNQNNQVLEHPDTTAIREHEINPLKSRVDKCYSTEKYEEFQKAVREITLETMGGEKGVEKIKKHATDAAGTYFSSEMWKQKTFWIPTVIAVIAIVVAYVRK